MFELRHTKCNIFKKKGRIEEVPVLSTISLDLNCVKLRC